MEQKEGGGGAAAVSGGRGCSLSHMVPKVAFAVSWDGNIMLLLFAFLRCLASGYESYTSWLPLLIEVTALRLDTRPRAYDKDSK